MIDHDGIPHDLRSRARALSDELGIAELGWDQETALELVSRLAGMGTPVLGGDVYVEEAGRLRPAYASWYCERLIDEDLAAFAKRSCGVAAQYLRAYSETPGQRTFYVLVVAKGEIAGML